MKPVIITNKIVGETLHFLQDGGRRQKETVVLWLGVRDDDAITVKQVYRPDQIAGPDMFHIPPPSMRQLLLDLGEKKLMIAAQVHSHPQQAFHSRADDVWAIVRHVDALSLVLPYFGLKTDSAGFFRDMKAFRLTPENQWLELIGSEVQKCINLQ